MKLILKSRQEKHHEYGYINLLHCFRSIDSDEYKDTTQMTHYFTSDWHWNHERSLRFSARTSFSTHKDLEKIILEGTLDTLKAGDVLYYLGDLMWKASPADLDEFFLPFKKKRVQVGWILGNHDSAPTNWLQSKSVIWIDKMKTVKVEGQKIVLCHYPMLCWDSSHHGSWLCHGHIHKGDSTHNKGFDVRARDVGKMLNVNVEFHNWLPWSFEEVKDVMNVRNQNWDYIIPEAQE